MRRLAAAEGPNLPSLAPAASSPPPASHVGSASSLPKAPTRLQGRKKVSVACESCKVSKKKCDRHQPCTNCQVAQKECIYDPLQDGRRHEVRKRRLDQLELRSQALEKLLVTLRSSSDSEAKILVELIKRDAPLEELLEFLDEHPGEVANETRAALSASPPPEGVGIRRMLAISELVDQPTVSVPAAPWTKVTKDDGLVSHLMSAYLNWYHFYYHIFDEHLFLEAMVAGNLDSVYCSPLLVNAVLGMGCFFSEHPLVFATPGDPSSRGIHFYNEAQRLWLLEAARPTLTNIQGFTIMIMLAAFSGKDRVSAASMRQLEIMVPQLLRGHAQQARSQVASEDYRRSLSIVEWATHFYATGFGIGLMSPPTSPKPSREAPYAAEVWRTDYSYWSPYPLDGLPVRLPLQALYNHLCEFYLLASDIQALVIGDFPSMNWVKRLAAAEKMDEPVLKWYNSLPPEFQADDPEFIIAPTTVDLAFSMHHFRQVMWYWTIPPPSTPPPPPDPQLEQSPASEPVTPEQIQEVRRKAKEVCLDITASIADLSLRFDAVYGPRFASMLTAQSSILATSFLLGGHLDSPREERLLLQLMRILVQCSRQRHLVRGVTQMLLQTAQQKVVPVDTEAAIDNKGFITQAVLESMQEVVKDFAWQASEHLHFSSQYPNYTLIKEDPTLEMSDLLEQWAEVTLDEKEAEAAPDQDRAPEPEPEPESASGRGKGNTSSFASSHAPDQDSAPEPRLESGRGRGRGRGDGDTSSFASSHDRPDPNQT